MKDNNINSYETQTEFVADDFKIVIEKKKSGGYGRAFHEEIEIKYYAGGKSALFIDGGFYIAEPGNISVTNPFEIHTNVEVEGTEGEYYYINVGLDFLTEQNPFGLDLRKLLLSGERKISNFIEHDHRLGTIITRIYEEYTEKKGYYKLIIYSLVTELFAILLREHMKNVEANNADQREKKTATMIAPALSLIFKEYARNITLDELAAASNLSKYHFARLFKAKMQMTPIEYITRYRVFLTESMIALGDMSVSEAALKCGFTDVSYFYRCFKKVKGYSHKQSAKKQYRPKS